MDTHTKKQVLFIGVITSIFSLAVMLIISSVVILLNEITWFKYADTIFPCLLLSVLIFYAIFKHKNVLKEKKESLQNKLGGDRVVLDKTLLVVTVINLIGLLPVYFKVDNYIVLTFWMVYVITIVVKGIIATRL